MRIHGKWTTYVRRCLCRLCDDQAKSRRSLPLLDVGQTLAHQVGPSCSCSCLQLRQARNSSGCVHSSCLGRAVSCSSVVSSLDSLLPQVLFVVPDLNSSSQGSERRTHTSYSNHRQHYSCTYTRSRARQQPCASCSRVATGAQLTRPRTFCASCVTPSFFFQRRPYLRSSALSGLFFSVSRCFSRLVVNELAVAA